VAVDEGVAGGRPGDKNVAGGSGFQKQLVAVLVVSEQLGVTRPVHCGIQLRPGLLAEVLAQRLDEVIAVDALVIVPLQGLVDPADQSQAALHSVS
jgi:hypothetical protein